MIRIIGATLVIAGVAGYIITHRSIFAFPAVGALLLLVGLISSERPGDSPDTAQGLLDIRQSANGELRVLDTEAGRHLLVN